MQYLAIIHTSKTVKTLPEEWADFFNLANKSGMFKGGSAVGKSLILGKKSGTYTSGIIGGFMKFESKSKSRLMKLLKTHPVVKNGGTVELFTLPKD